MRIKLLGKCKSFPRDVWGCGVMVATADLKSAAYLDSVRVRLPSPPLKGEWCNGSHSSLRSWCLVRAGSNPASPMHRLQYDGKQFRSLNGAIH